MNHEGLGDLALSQVASGDPAAIRSLYEALMSKRYSELAAISTIQVALTEETFRSSECGEPFHFGRYIDLASNYTRHMLQRTSSRLLRLCA